MQQQSMRVLISKRVQNRCCSVLRSNKKQSLQQCQNRRSISSIAVPSSLLTARSYPSTGTSYELSKHHQQYRCYGSKLKVELDRHPEKVVATPAIEPYLRTCLRTSLEDEANNSNADNNGTNDNEKYKSADMEFAVTFLGTGGGTPTMHRSGSCTALRLGGQTFLFDVSEGTLRQLQFTRISPMSITKIFISHLHGDHLFGIVPVIMGIMISHKVAMQATPENSRKQRRKNNWKKKNGIEDSMMTKEKPTLEIYGPPGLYNYIGMVISLSCSKLNYLNVKVIELVGGKEERGPFQQHTADNNNQRRGGGGGGQRGNRRNVFTSHYPEIHAPLVTRQFLQQNDDMTWTIDAPEQITTTTQTIGKEGFHRLPNDTNLGTDRRLHIKAAELDHLSGVQTFGYVVEEQPPPGTIDKDKAVALGVQPSKKYGLLKCGISVPTDDGTGEVHPSQVLSNVFRPRKFSLLADHRLVPVPMAKLCANSDVLVHEATLSKKHGVNEIKTRGHQNAFNAGAFAKRSGCKLLALNHFGGLAFGNEMMTEIMSEARSGNEDASEIIASYDFMEVYVPRGGFDFGSEKQSKDSSPNKFTWNISKLDDKCLE